MLKIRAPFISRGYCLSAFTCLLALMAGMPSAFADIAVEFECTIPASSTFDCNLLKQRFFKDKKIPFVKEAGSALNVTHSLKVSVGRLPVLNGFNYEIVVTEKGGGKSKFTAPVFLSDGVNPTSALQQINAAIQQPVLAFAKTSEEAKTEHDIVTMTYEDPSKKPTAPKSAGRWVLKPNVSLYFSKKSEIPASINASGGAAFDYSGKLDRYTANASGSFSRQSVVVIVGDKQELHGVDNYSAGASGAMIHGIDKDNHINLVTAGSIATNPLFNIKTGVNTKIGVEYNAHPFLKGDSKSLAVGCALGPSYYDFNVPNTLEKQQFLGLSQSCAISGTLLLDQQRGTTVTATVGENWLVNAPSYASVNASLSANLRVTERLTVRPEIDLNWQTKSITTASEKSAPSLIGLSPQEIAEEQTKFTARAASAAEFSITGSISLVYTFGDGENRTSQDQRGNSLRQ